MEELEQLLKKKKLKLQYNMEDISIYEVVKNYDPTHTTALRNAFVREMKRRFNELTMAIYTAVLVNDCFGLKTNVSTFQLNIPERGEFAFTRSSQKVEAFMIWLRRQVDKGLLTIHEYEQIGSAANAAWTNLYVADSYKRGVIRARQELKKAGYSVPSIDESGGIDVVMGAPFHLDRVGLMFTRVFEELKGITAAMDSQISRVLAQGIADGDGVKVLTKKLLNTIEGGGDKLGVKDTLGRVIPAKRRAEVMVRTELIRAHHLATIQEYRNWGVLGITVLGEWKTAGDERVCAECEKLEGRHFTLDEIEPMIPLHPQCRCIALPYIKELEPFYKRKA